MTDLTRQLQGKLVEAVYSNGCTLQIRTRDGAEINVQWVNENGDPIRGRPVVTRKGWRLKAAMRDLLYLPGNPNQEGRRHSLIHEVPGFR